MRRRPGRGSPGARRSRDAARASTTRASPSEVFAAAREARAAHFGDGVFLYGFVYFSTYCRNECAFCYYRADNALSPRYRKTAGRGRRHLRGSCRVGCRPPRPDDGRGPAHPRRAGLPGAARPGLGGARRDRPAGHGVAGRAARRGAARPARRRGRLLRPVPGDAHAGALRAAARRAGVRGARRGAPRRAPRRACSSRTASSPASATPPPTGRARSRRCATRAGRRCAR